jgi:hypothetical protein
MSQTSNETKSESTSIDRKITEGGNILRQRGAAEAAVYFNGLLETTSNPEEIGRIELNIGSARLQSNPVEAIALLKEVSINESYLPFTRAKATNYVLNAYTSSNDQAFAREHIFTGPVWGDFFGSDLQEATLTGFYYSADLSPTPEANMRIASELGAQIAFGELTAIEAEGNAAAARDYIRFGNQQIALLLDSGQVEYGGTPPEEIATAMNRRGLALDFLYFAGYIDQAEEVKDSYREAISYLIDNPIDIDNGTKSFVRYNYADFLYRLDSEAEAQNIRTVLSPVSNMTRNNAFTSFANRKLNTDAPETRPLNMVGHPDTMRQIIALSDEFRSYVLGSGSSNVPPPVQAE